ncbi:hypothetical protein HK405_009739, partial [Cladochytrium tenue]
TQLPRLVNEAAVRAAIDANHASRKAFEDARKAARAARDIYRLGRRGGGHHAAFPLAAASTAAAPAEYGAAAAEAASRGFGLGTPEDPRWAGGPSSTSASAPPLPSRHADAGTTGSGGGGGEGELYAAQVARLREMGFTDAELCRDLLAEHDGEVAGVVEALARLGLAGSTMPMSSA